MMKRIVNKKRKTFIKSFYNEICLILCISQVIFLFSPTILAASSNLRNSTYAVDLDTTDDYIGHMINDENGSRYAGRIWTDKSVFIDKIELDEETDGYKGTITNDSDFLHAFSVLGSSQAWIGLPPSRTVIVIDNSGSMYENNTAWEKTRIAKTVESVNKAIDILMHASQYNEVAVVLFGDGPDSNATEENSQNVHPYHGNSTATTILPMKHYNVSITNEPLKYIDSGWAAKDAVANGDSLDHTNKTSSGWVFVNNEIAELNSDNTKENKKYNWFDSEKWNGWNNCGDKKYTTYKNGTTNIQAGIYQGMQELLKAEKTLKIAGTEYNCVPSLVLLTDGAATDSLKSWLNPKTDENGYLISHLGYLNEFSYKGTSFIGKNDTRGSHSDHNNTAWNQFLAIFDSEGNPIKNIDNLPYIGSNFELVASADLDDNQLFSFEEYTYKSRDGNEIKSTHITEDSLIAAQNFANNYRDSQAYMLFSYLLTASYYKQVVKNAYKVEDDWDIYTISVDMDDPSKDDYKAGYVNTKNQNEGNEISSNPFMMDPGKYFNKQFLIDKGFLLNETSDENNTFYDDYTVADKTVEGILKARNAWDAYVKGDFESWNKNGGITTYRGITSGYNLKSNNIKNKIKTYKNGEYYYNGKLGLGVKSTYELTGTGAQSDFSNEGIFPGPGHDTYFRVGGELKINEDFFIPTETDDHNIDLTKLDYDYVTESYYASSSSTDGDSIEKVFDTIVESIKKPAFTPTHDNFSKNDTLSYSDPIGKYMEVKNVKNLLLFGKLYDIKKTDVKYVVIENDEEKEYDTKPSKYDYKRQYYQIVNNGEDKLVNDCYRVIDESDEYDSVVTYNLSDFEIYVDTKTKSGPLENDQELHFEIPVLSLPLQVVTIKLNPDGSSAYYQTNVENKKESTPLRLFYEVGVVDNIKMNNDKDIDLDKIDKEYLKKYTTEGDYLNFFSNYYSESTYDGYTADIQDDARTKGDAVLSISPSVENRYYIFQKNLKLYDYAYVIEENGEVEKENNPLLFEGADFDGVYNGKTENNQPNAEGLASIKAAFEKGELKDGDIIFLSGDTVPYGTNPSSDDFYYFAIDYYMPTPDNTGELVQYVIARRGSEFGSGILQDEGNIIPKGDFLSWIDASEKHNEVYDYNTNIPDDKKNDGNWVLATKIGGLRIGDLHQSILRKTDNKTGTSKSYYLPVISHANSSKGSDVILSGYLGNNGLLTYKIEKWEIPAAGSIGTIIITLLGIILIIISSLLYKRHKKGVIPDKTN